MNRDFFSGTGIQRTKDDAALAEGGTGSGGFGAPPAGSGVVPSNAIACRAMKPSCSVFRAAGFVPGGRMKARPMAHVRIFFKDLAHLMGIVSP